MVYVKPYNVCWSDEKFTIMLKRDKFVEVKILYELGRMIALSEIIPWYRKFYLPVALWRYGWLIVGGRLISYCPADVRNRLKRVKLIYALYKRFWV